MTDVLYAGKFKTVEELEAGYNNAAKVYQDNADLQKKYEEAQNALKAPDDYQIPQGIELHDNDIRDLKDSAAHKKGHKRVRSRASTRKGRRRDANMWKRYLFFSLTPAISRQLSANKRRKKGTQLCNRIFDCFYIRSPECSTILFLSNYVAAAAIYIFFSFL